MTTTVVFSYGVCVHRCVGASSSCTKLLTHAKDYFDLACTNATQRRELRVCVREEALCVFVKGFQCWEEVSKSTAVATTTKQQ